MTVPYRPDLATFCDILRDYSRHGLLYFREQSSDTQGRIRSALGGGLEDSGDQIDAKFAAIKRGGQSQLRFLPMPRPGGNDFKASFFLPRIDPGPGANYSCSFTVLFWIERDTGRTIAMRFESSDGPGNAHAYTHMQLTRTIGAMTTSFEQWIPDSYPAVPLSYDHPLQLFVGMAVAVHGYSANEKNEYVRAAMTASMAQGSALERARKILDEVRRILG